MPLLVLSYLLQIACAVHALRRGYPIYLIFLILAFPVMGVLIYLIAVVLPEWKNSRQAAQAALAIKQTLDPDGDLRSYVGALEVADTVENRLQLADELCRRGQPQQAIEHYKHCLQGAFEDNPGIMLRLAGAYFETARYGAARTTLEELVDNNPGFKSPEGRLLYARTLEALGDNDGALREYEQVSRSFAGLEAKCRYALLLKRTGDSARAATIFHEIDTNARHAPRQFNKLQQRWIDLARAELGEAGARNT